MLVSVVTTESRTSIIQRNTKPSSVKPTQIVLKAANMEICAHSRTMKMNLPLICLRKWTKIWTSSCSTTKLFGVLLATKPTPGTNACTLIIGKTSAENRMFMSTYLSSVKCGSAKRIQKIIKTVAHWSTVVECAMDGKNSSFIRIFTKRRSAARKLIIFATNLTVPTIIQMPKDALRSMTGSRSNRGIANLLREQAFNTRMDFTANFSRILRVHRSLSTN